MPAPFSYERKLRNTDVLVKITHCSVSMGDIQMMDDDWGDTRFPLVPCHEIIGIIEKTGAEVTNIKNGDRVGIGYQQEACFKCVFCKGGKEQFCPHQKVTGVHCYGGLAEHIIVDGRFAFKLPAGIDAVKSIGLLSSGLTVYAAIKSAGLPKNAVVGVAGIGGLGQLAIQYLHKMGHRISGFSHSPEKKKLIHQLGATYIDSEDPEGLKVYNRKFDFILSTVNAGFDLDAYIKMLLPQGKLCLVASPLTKQSVSTGLLYDYAQRTIYGNYTGSRRDMKDMLTFSAKHGIESAAQSLPFHQMNEAIEMVRAKKLVTKLVLENSH